ncbi:MAG: MFS transporter [Streptococcaceae bacterium]|nr:MFS transporter [Streptococcaceae bacterium]
MNRSFLVIIATCIGIFLCMLDTTVMNIALPAIQNGLNTNLSNLSWAINAYTIVFAALTIPLSRVAEKIGLHKFFMGGLLLFLVGSVISAMSPNLVYLIVGRIIQSLGAATVFPLSMVIGISTVNVERRTRVIAALGVTQGLAAALGPTIGGILTQFASWRWIFLVNAPLIVIALILSLVALNFHEERKNIKIDIFGALISIISLFTLTLALVQGRDWGWSSLIIVLLFVVSFSSLTIFIVYERKIDYSMIPMKLFKNRQFNGAALTIVLSNLFLVAVTVVLPTYFTKIQGKSELIAALLVTPISAMIFVFSPIAALLIKKIGARIVIGTGFLAMTGAYILFTRISMTNISEVVSTCLLLGFGYGIIAGPIVVLAASDFTGEMLTASQSVAGVLRQVGIVLAVAIFVTGLYGNINTAKSQSIDYAKNQIVKLKLPTAQAITMQKQVIQQIQDEKSSATFDKNHVSEQEKEALIQENYKAALSGKAGLSSEVQAAILQKVTVAVTSEISKMNTKINASILDIVSYTKQKFSNAFIDLYKLSIVFVGLSTFSAILFTSENKSKYQKV